MTRYLVLPTLLVFALGLGAGWALRRPVVQMDVVAQRCVTFELPPAPPASLVKPASPSLELPVRPDSKRSHHPRAHVGAVHPGVQALPSVQDEPCVLHLGEVGLWNGSGIDEIVRDGVVVCRSRSAGWPSMDPAVATGSGRLDIGPAQPLAGAPWLCRHAAEASGYRRTHVCP